MSDILKEQKEKIITLLKEKSTTKQEVYHNTLKCFDMVKECLNEISTDLKPETDLLGKRILNEVSETQTYSIQLKLAGDVLEFFMHTNVFEFSKTHPMYKTTYIKQNDYNSFCGIINVYNFLADSFKYNRINDIGYLICRIFINREMRFFIEAVGPLGIKYSSFSFEPITKEQLMEIINGLVIQAITFDLFTPPIDQVREVTVGEIQEKVTSINLRTGKRLGYGSNNAPAEEDSNMYI